MTTTVKGLCQYYAVPQKPGFRRPHGNPLGYTPIQIGQLYNYPTHISGPDVTIDLIELGGGYSLQAIQQQFASWNLPAPTIVDVNIDGAKNSYSGNPSSADVEVELDIVVAAGIYSYCTGRAARIRVIFCPNTDSGFINGVNACNGPTGISWGAMESAWAAASRAAMDNSFMTRSSAGATFFAASGDNGSSDGGSGDNCDYPASSPNVVGCGGTTIATATIGGVLTLVNESVWNHDGGGGGGGFSKVYSAPAYQSGFVPVGKNRGVPDLSANADPETGYQTPFGVIGGTSAVAPLMAGLFAAYCSGAGKLLGNVSSLLYANEPCFNDVTLGNNGDFSAGKGWDAATGLGSIQGNKFYLTAVVNGSTPPPVPVPVPPPIPIPPTPTPVPPIPPTGPTIAVQFPQGMPAGRYLINWRYSMVLHNSVKAGNYNLVSSTPHELAEAHTIDWPTVAGELRLAISLLGPFAEPVLEGWINSQDWITGVYKQELIGLLKQVLTGANPPQWLVPHTGVINWQQWVTWLKNAVPYLGIFAEPILTAVINNIQGLSDAQKQLLIQLLKQVLAGITPTPPSPVPVPTP